MTEVIHTLWIGDTLSALERLTLRSFVAQGYEVRLWVYNRLDTFEQEAPLGVKVCDANSVLDGRHIFRYNYPNQFGHGKGSLAGFSDLFRYKVLYEYGGWWADMDMTCLRVLDFDTAYVFRAHDQLAVVGNLIKCPAKSELMRYCFERCLKEVDANNRDWFLPITILNDGVAKFQLEGFIYHNISNPDRWDIVQPLLESRKPIPAEWRVIHWMNEEWRSRGRDKNTLYERSVLADLALQYGEDKATLIPWTFTRHYWRRIKAFVALYWRKLKGKFR